MYIFNSQNNFSVKKAFLHSQKEFILGQICQIMLVAVYMYTSTNTFCEKKTCSDQLIYW